MAVVNCILDQIVHRTSKLGLTMTKTGTYPQVTLQPDTSAAYPSGHRLEIYLQNGGNAINVRCENIKKPQTRDVQICVTAPCTGMQWKMGVDDAQYRVYVLGQELSTTPNVSFMIISQQDITDGTISDILMYSDSNGNNLAVPAGGPGNKIPPNLG
jgi:hypothetical protein